jgi:adenine-specific DNA-methyltransferase
MPWAALAAATLGAFARARGLSLGSEAVRGALGLAQEVPAVAVAAPPSAAALLEALERGCLCDPARTQVMTPPAVARWLAAQAGAGQGEVLDPAAGSGRLLLAALEARLARGEDPLRAVEVGLRGVELDPAAACVARAALAARALEAGAAALPRPDVRCGDALLVAHAPADVILLNPPYGSADQLSGAHHEAARRRWPFWRHQQDRALWFLALSAQALRPQGRLAAIVPRYWLESTGAASFRAWLKEALALELLCDLGDAQVWPRVEVLTALLVARRAAPPLALRLWRPLDRRSEGALDQRSEGALDHRSEGASDHRSTPFPWASLGVPPGAYALPYGALGEAPWVWRAPSEEARLAVVEAAPSRAQDWFEIGQGCKSGLNEVFALSPARARALGIAEALLAPLVRARQIVAGGLRGEDARLLLILPETDWRACAATAAHLEAHRVGLEARYQARQGACPWFALSLPQNLAWMRAPKLLSPLYARENRFAADLEGRFVLTDAYFLGLRGPSGLSLGALSLLLSAAPLRRFVEARAKLKRDGYREYGGRLLRSLPLPLAPWEAAGPWGEALEGLWGRRRGGAGGPGLWAEVDALAWGWYEAAARR